MALIDETELNTRLAANSNIVAYMLIGRPAKAPYPVFEGKQVNVADIYFLIESGGNLSLSFVSDQLALPVGKTISGRVTAKPIVSTLRTNAVVVQEEGGGGG